MPENPESAPGRGLSFGRDKLVKILHRFIPRRFSSGVTTPEEPIEPVVVDQTLLQLPADIHDDPQWKNRSFTKLLPAGSKTRKIDQSTFTDVEYGEKTWTTDQTIRDILQNHLDANTDRFVAQLTSSVLDIDTLTKGLSPDQQKKLDDFTYALFLYKKCAADFTPQTAQEVSSKMADLADGLPLRPQVKNTDGQIDIDKLNEVIEPINEAPPAIFYKVEDRFTTDARSQSWVSLDQMRALGSEAGRYQVMGIRIADSGSGFDTKLTAIYKSTKTGRRYLRGKFGEGAKMSEVHLIRNGAKVVMRSNYSLVNGEQTQRTWKSRAILDSDQTVRMRGVEVSVPSNGEETQGSYTEIDIKHANPDFQREFRAAVDYFGGRGLALHCLSYSSQRYLYPTFSPEAGLGVNLAADAKLQYVQGLLVDGQVEQYNLPVFSYDFLDSSILQGRDRSLLSPYSQNHIESFWKHADSEVLQQELVKRIFLEGRSHFYPPEGRAFYSLMHPEVAALDPQAVRTRTVLLDLLPQTLGIEEGSKNVVVSEEMERGSDAPLIKILEHRGYRIIHLKKDLGSAAISRLREHHPGKFELYSLADLRNMKDALIGVIDPEDERVKIIEPIYRAAYTELAGMISEAGIAAEAFNLEDSPAFLESLDPGNELAVELDFDTNKDKFILKIRPEMIVGEGRTTDTDYWKQRIQVELLASLARLESFPDRNSLLNQSQEMAQIILTASLRKGMVDTDLLPTSFNHQLSSPDANRSMQTFFERLTHVESSISAWQTYDQARDIELNLDQFANLAISLSSYPKDYQDRIGRILLNRVVIENGEVGFYQQEEGKLVFSRKKLEELPIVGSIKDRTVYQAGAKLFILNHFPKDSIIKIDRSNLVFWQNQLLEFRGGEFSKYGFSLYPIIDKEALVYPFDNRYGTNFEVQMFERAMGYLEVSAVERRRPIDVPFLSGIRETPLPLEYGIHEWNNPIRVFEDIVQNHIDADFENKAYLRYEVLRDNQRLWIQAEDFLEEDTIVGLEVSDKGSGYLPNDLGTMGNSSKKSPLFAGKYGEGQKMVAAACARNGFELVYSSTAQNEGKSYLWKARVNTQDEKIVVGGVPTTTKRVIYNVDSEILSEEIEYSSSTTLRLPEGVLPNHPDWLRWTSIIDPRIKDERGNSGLARYVLNLRPPNSNVIDLGYMRVLLDEKGKVYENGLFVTTGGTALSYDVPEIVVTRERNAIDHERLSNYIAHAIKESKDPRLAQTLLRLFREKYITPNTGNEEPLWVTEEDLNFGNLMRYDNFIPSRPYWDVAYANIAGGYFVHSQEALQKQIDGMGARIKSARQYSTVEQLEEYGREYAKALITLANIDHVPKDRIIQIRDHDYSGWAELFPSVEDYIVSISEQELPVGEDVLTRLNGIVGGSTQVIREVLDEMRDDPDKNATFLSIISGLEPGQIKYPDVDLLRNAVQLNVDLWSILTTLGDKNSVFVSPQTAGYLGLATKNRIGFNEQVLVDPNPNEVVGIARHELVHKIFGLRDYSPEFIMMLLELTRYNLAH